ncbi:MAG: CRTAC1 family protein [Acidobacteriota bacterium]
MGKAIRSAPRPVRLSPLLLLSLLPLLAQQKWQFTEVSRPAGIDFTVISGTTEKKFLVETMAAGNCVLDFDGDGWPDLYFANGTTRQHWNQGSGPSGRLYRNNRDGTVSDVTKRAGLQESAWGMGCVSADYDNDGDVDLYLTNFGPNLLYRNNGDGTFSEAGQAAGLADPLWSTGAAFGDYDRDGDLDLYLANYVRFDFEKPAGDPRFCAFRGVTVACGPRGLPAAPDRLFRNNGDGTFSDVSRASGIASADPLYGFQVLWTDIDLDGDPDIFVANDSKPNFLWLNNGDGTFEESALFQGLAYNQEGREQACMGADLADFDLDGDLDLYSTNFSDDYHILYRNTGKSFFQDATFKAKIAQITFQYLGFGTFFADLNNDGLPDLFAANGHIYPQVDRFNLGSDYKQKNQLFRNLGQGLFKDAGSGLGSGLAIAKSSRGASYLDFDRDGDLDIAVSNLDDPVDLLRNDLPTGSNWLQVTLRGRRSNRDGVGARVRLKVGSRSYLQEMRSGSSYLSDHQRMLHFGLGKAAEIDSLEVWWPSGKTQQLDPPPVNTRILVDEESGIEIVP